jgi:hypothetical protein
MMHVVLAIFVDFDSPVMVWDPLASVGLNNSGIGAQLKWKKWSSWSKCVPPLAKIKQSQGRRCLFYEHLHGMSLLLGNVPVFVEKCL